MANDTGEHATDHLSSAIDMIADRATSQLNRFLAQRAFVVSDHNPEPCAAKIVENAIDQINHPAAKLVAKLIEDVSPDGQSARYGCIQGCPGVVLRLDSDTPDVSLCQKLQSQ